ncbi:TPA: putative quorum-sensing-regulated virulence factor [Vibrio parahaemolyticus]
MNREIHKKNLKKAVIFWLDKKGWPSGELGDLLKLCLALKIEGLDSVVKPLKRM